MVAAKVAKLKHGQKKPEGSIEPSQTQREAAQQLSVSRETVKGVKRGRGSLAARRGPTCKCERLALVRSSVWSRQKKT